MRQTHELTAAPLLSDEFSWCIRTKSAHACSKILKRKLITAIFRYRHLFLTGIATLFLSVLFLTSSYLFLFQLAEHGW